MGTSDLEYNTSTDSIPEYEDRSSVSFIAYESSNKTVTQEEQEDEKGYTGKLDEDPYKQFKQGYFRYLSENGIPDDGIHAKIVMDSNDLPHSEETKRYIDAGNPYGQVMIITNSERNPLYFDDNYNSTTEPGKDGFRPLIYSFDQQVWKDSEALRAMIGENRTGQSYQSFLNQYEVERTQQSLARELAKQGKETPIDINFISNGVLRNSKNAIKSSSVITPDFNYNLLIPSLREKFDPANPTKNKYVITGNQALVNGGLYAQVVDKTGINSYIRLIPNIIGDSPEVAENVTTLLNHEYTDQNDAFIASNHLRDLLFLDKPKRPAIRIGENSEGKFVIRIIQDNVTLDPETAITFSLAQRINAVKSNISSNSYFNVELKNGKIDADIKDDYDKFLLDNSTTHSIPIKTSDGASFLPINSYATFSFLDSPESMRANLRKKDGTPPGERDMDFKKNEIPVLRHVKNKDDYQSLSSGWDESPIEGEGINEAHELGKKLKKFGITQIITSPILRALQTAQQAATTSNVKTIGENPDLRTWNLGQFTSKPKADFDELYFITHPDEIEKDGVRLGETFNTFLNRALKAYNEFKNSKYENTAIITHSKVIRIWDAYKENNELWNDNAIARYWNLPSNFAFTSIAKKEQKSDDAALTSTPLRRLGKPAKEETEQERIEKARKLSEDQNKQEGLTAKKDVRENRPFIKESEITKVNRIFGHEVASKIDDIANSDAVGLWTTSGIKLFRDAREGDGYHEAWHHFSQLYLTAERNSVH